jgi:hypothetical protein
VLAVLRIELRRTLLAKRSIPVYVLALLPVGLFAMKALVAPFTRGELRLAEAVTIYGIVYQTFILRLCIFFGCVTIFTNLIRGELLDRSLHYYFLVPIRREVLLVGKYVAGVIASAAIFGTSVLLSSALNFAPHGRAQVMEHLFGGPGIGHLLAYLAVAVLGCVGYGAVFLTIGLFFRNPVILAAPICLLEAINFLLPPFLKKLSVIHYLQSLCPFQISQGSIAILADPAPVWLAVPGLVAVTLALLALAGWRIRGFEVLYGPE